MVICFRVRTNRPTHRLNLHVSSISPLPKSYSDAFNDLNWQNAMSDEYNLFRHKYLVDDTLSGYKARFVANGSIQVEGIDVDETFSALVKLSSIQTGTHTACLLLYVDDIVLSASSDTLLQQIIASLHQEFSMTDLGSLNYFLCVYVTRDSLRMFLSQWKYVVKILERIHMVYCNPSRTHVDTKSKLGDDGDPVSDLTLYQSLGGSLKYLTFTRTDISYAMQHICLYMHDPWEPHFLALKWILSFSVNPFYVPLSFQFVPLSPSLLVSEPNREVSLLTPSSYCLRYVATSKGEIVHNSILLHCRLPLMVIKGKQRCHIIRRGRQEWERRGWDEGEDDDAGGDDDEEH
ncbi:ribonuclease H-like domain-containing protein [Tanacetum coccineum]